MNALAEITGAVVDGTFAPRRAITVCEVCQTMLRAAHKQRATSRAKLTYDLAPLIERHGDEPVQRLTKAHIDQLMDKATSAAVGCHRSQQVRQTAANGPGGRETPGTRLPQRRRACRPGCGRPPGVDTYTEAAGQAGADDGNRTRVFSLGS
jgi:hypothetical protein